MKKLPFTFSILVLIAILLSGCVDCMIQGLDARECGRMKDNAKIIDTHNKKLNEFNKTLKSEAVGKVMSSQEVEGLLGKTCNRFKGATLSTDMDTALLGNYYKTNFCKLYESNQSLVVQKKEVKHSNNTSGTMYFLLTDGKQVLEYFAWPISYTKKGYRFGSY